MVATAATQGVYSRVNTRKLTADTGVKIFPRVSLKLDMEEPVRTPSVLTTASFAVKPPISAVAARQSPNPNGIKRGAISFPIMASRLSPESVTTLNRVSNVCKNQISSVATKIIVKARCTKSFALSHIKSSTLLAEGNR